MPRPSSTGSKVGAKARATKTRAEKTRATKTRAKKTRGAKAGEKTRAAKTGVKAGAKAAEKTGTKPRRLKKLSGGGGASEPRILHLDTFSGIAGNMFAAALLDLGLERKQLEQDLAGLGVDHRLKLSRTRRGSLSARFLEVVVPGQTRLRKRGKSGHAHLHAQTDAQTNAQTNAQADHAHDHGPHGPQAGGSRSYAEITDLIGRARLAENVRNRALAIFEALGRAEARVHGVSLDEVHFHEVGAVDAIVDVTAAAIGIERLGVVRVTSSPVALGYGMIDSSHGRLPLPAPATLELLKGIPTVPAHVEWETVTPTGAAILRTLVDEFTSMPAMTVEAVGLGAGNDRPGPVPNVLRAVIGRSNEGLGRDRIVVLEANLDDLVPEHFDYVMERLFAAGALDVSIQHIQMKKNRPGFLLRVLARPGDRMDLAGILFAESGTLGVRSQEWERLLLDREEGRVQTPYGRIAVKWVRDINGALQVSAEYDACKRAAQRAGVPLREVVRCAEETAREQNS
ncbi:MAG TPA: nickel pincer cofactor biosynthesis protein LarC [Myxococcales bacterium]|nr:nickel pincer cofactor biosynthesis protein LarC [Myxococcales bacterium]